MSRPIDADKLLEKQFFSLDDDGYGMMVVSVTDIISAPTVERKKGRWIAWREIFPKRIFASFLRKNRGFCSYCGAYKNKDNYCPNCGADMRGDGDGK